MAVNKVFPSFAGAVADIPDGATIMIDGFGGEGGMSSYLILALRDHGAKNLTIIGNTAGMGGFGTKTGREYVHPGILVKNKQVRKVIASFPVHRSPSLVTEFERAYRAGEVELEMVPQGTMAERIRAGGAGIGAFFTPTGAGAVVEQGKEKRVIDGKDYILEHALFADYAFVRAYKADKLGNLIYRGTSRVFNAVMATAARVTIAEVDEVVEPGELDPEKVVTPAVYVKRIVQRPKEGQI